LASPSAPKSVKKQKSQPCEESWVLVGQRRGRIWHSRRIWPSRGEPAEVAFDAAAVLAREERRGDVVGFFHTHPSFVAKPSKRDIATMRGWVSSFGKPLLCLIEGTDGLQGFRFDDDESRGDKVTAVELFPRGVVIAVDDTGEIE